MQHIYSCIRRNIIEIYQLKTFATVAELGQLTRAGEALHVSQPAVTAQIKALEDEFGVALFERAPGGMILTRAGQQLLPYAEEVLRSAQKLKNASKSMLGEVAGKVALGTLSAPDFIRLGDFLNAMVERYPLIELELHHQISGGALEHVRDGTIEASFYYGELTHPNIAGLHLRDMTYCIAAPASWKEKVEDKEWSEIAALPWVMAPSISTHNSLLRGLFAEEGTEPIKVVEADHESVINSLILSGVGLGLMLEEQALSAAAAGEVVIVGKTRLRTKLWFIYPAESANDPAIRAVTDVICETWKLDPALRAIGTTDQSGRPKLPQRRLNASNLPKGRSQVGGAAFKAPVESRSLEPSDA